MKYLRTATPQKHNRKHRGVTKAPFNFKRAKKAKKIADKSRRINRK